jgi:hypothetical protein
LKIIEFENLKMGIQLQASSCEPQTNAPLKAESPKLKAITLLPVAYCLFFA